MKRILLIVVALLVLTGCAFRTTDGTAHVVKAPGVDYVLCGISEGCDFNGWHYEFGEWAFDPPPAPATTTVTTTTTLPDVTCSALDCPPAAP